MTETLTLYTAKICPFAQRVELALAEAKAPFERYEIDLSNKPEWYAPKINPVSKVPAVAYGGPKTSPENPSPESQKIAESLVLLEFVADLYPDSGLLPKDPVMRAKVRFFMDAIATKTLPGYFAFSRGEGPEKLLEGIEAIQSLLPADGKYIAGDTFTIGDAAFSPFFARLEVSALNKLGRFSKEDGQKVYETLAADPKYERFRRYYNDLKERDSFKATFDAEYIKNEYQKRFANAK